MTALAACGTARRARRRSRRGRRPAAGGDHRTIGPTEPSAARSRGAPAPLVCAEVGKVERLATTFELASDDAALVFDFEADRRVIKAT